MPNKKGFTLIELLVVIAIIGILSAIGMVTYQAINRNTRDGKRQADLKIVQGALEQYHADQFFYPASLSFGSANSLTSCTGNPNPPCPTPTPPARIYLNQMPSDPLGSPDYNYVPSPLGCDNDTPVEYCTSYCLYSYFEGSNPPSSPTCPNHPTNPTQLIMKASPP